METWAVNSYSYPNPFQTSAPNSLAAWEVFRSFVDRTSYSDVKAHWGSNTSRQLNPHTVESWKAAFEEFGLLYVLSGTDVVTITPGGQQILAAAEAADIREFAWVGLKLIMRYPLRGEPGRRSRGPLFQCSDLLLYWFLLAAIVELGGFWQQELYRVLGRVFQRTQAQSAIDIIIRCRVGEQDIAAIIDPTGGGVGGGVYNSLNQVMNHGSLHQLLFSSTRIESHYFPVTRENWWHVREDLEDVIQLALGDLMMPLPPGCSTHASHVQRMPAAPTFEDEQAYLDYMGAAVTPLGESAALANSLAAQEIDYGGDLVFLLEGGRQFSRVDHDRITGPVHSLCVLAEGRRVIVSDDLTHTFIVEHKQMVNDEIIVVQLRMARPILDVEYVTSLFGGSDDD